jgi:glycyl-tRNA synthetase (class II)
LKPGWRRTASKLSEEVIVENLSLEQMGAFITRAQGFESLTVIRLTEPKAFNLLFETAIGAVCWRKV